MFHIKPVQSKITYLIGSLIDEWLKHSFYLTFYECFSLLQPINTTPNVLTITCANRIFSFISYMYNEFS